MSNELRIDGVPATKWYEIYMRPLTHRRIFFMHLRFHIAKFFKTGRFKKVTA
jgi:hypothetical protein